MMVHHHRNSVQRKREEETLCEAQALVECGGHAYRRSRPRLIRLLTLFALIFCTLVSAPQLLRGSSATLPFVYGNDAFTDSMEHAVSACPSTLRNGTLCCDRSGFRSDICYLKGDIRTVSSTKSVFLYSAGSNTTFREEEEEITKIRPYTRKWETSVMNTIDELTLIKTSISPQNHRCDVYHSVPAIFFSTGCYTGNVYHEFNDGILPLYITSQSHNKEVIFVILEYHNWWMTKYGDILSHLTNYPPIDFAESKRNHCFSEVIAGLNIHDELTVNSSLMQTNPKTVTDFRNLLDDAYMPRINGILQEEEKQLAEESGREGQKPISNPKLVIISRNNSRTILNQERLVELAEEIGFRVQVLWPTKTTELAKIYRALNSTDVMIGVHGAAMTHFLFMRPGSVFIQVVPLGTDWAAQTYYGDPAIKFGLKYVRYKILPRESSLFSQYDRDDPVLTNPTSLTKKGWEVTKRVYLDGQNVNLELKRFRKRLLIAHDYAVARIRRQMSGL